MTTISRRTALAAALAATLAAQIPLVAVAQDAPVVEVKDLTLGSNDAKVKITEYASFTCSHCAHFHETNWAKLKAEYIDTGKVQFTYREVYFDRYGLWAAIIARCGGEMKYFGISDMLFETQAEWAGSNDPKVVVENLKKIGRTAGLDDAQMDACLKDKPTAEALVAMYQKNSEADAIEGTPTLFINGTKFGNLGWDDLKAAIDAELAK